MIYWGVLLFVWNAAARLEGNLQQCVIFISPHCDGHCAASWLLTVVPDRCHLGTVHSRNLQWQA